ncbi:15364_t:CDS:2 [Rhizophagus irregularis]|nr:15364_t:CDS:2 [Rhizophagus irregularis]
MLSIFKNTLNNFIPKKLVSSNLYSLYLYRNLSNSFQKRLLTSSSSSNNDKNNDENKIEDKIEEKKEIDEIDKNEFNQENNDGSKYQPSIDDILVPTEENYILHIHASYNNTIVTLTNSHGNILITKSGGSVGFKKSQRGGYEAAHQAAIGVIQKIKEKNLNVKNVEICINGFGPGRDAAFKAIANVENQWNVRRITDTTPLPFNGCRPRKLRRL